jgi:hypothetical protein
VLCCAVMVVTGEECTGAFIAGHAPSSSSSMWRHVHAAADAGGGSLMQGPSTADCTRYCSLTLWNLFLCYSLMSNNSAELMFMCKIALSRRSPRLWSAKLGSIAAWSMDGRAALKWGRWRSAG